jgi:hypothetical protein
VVAVVAEELVVLVIVMVRELLAALMAVAVAAVQL